MAQTLHVVGGGAGIGRWLIDRVFALSGKIYCYDTNERALQTLPSAVIPCALSDETGYEPFSGHFQPGDWILLVVPTTVFKDTITSLIPLIKPGSLVVTLSSIQAEPIAILKAQVPLGCFICGFHPLFGPAVSSPVGQLVALTEFHEDNEQHRRLRNLLETKGLIVSTLLAAEHDYYMSYVQALVHFCLIGFAATLGKDGVHPRDLLKLRTPNFQFLYAFASRVIKLSPTTTGAIQTTRDASRIRVSMIETLKILHDQFESAETAAACAKVIEVLRAPLTGAEVDEGAEVASLAADTLQDFEGILYKHKSIESPFVFRHRATGKVKIVRITDIRHDEIRFEEATKLIKREDKSYFAIALFETARKNYRAVGLNIPKASRDSVKKRNIKLLDREELDSFFKTEVLPIVIDHNFFNPLSLEEDYFEDWLPLVVTGLWRCDFLESFRKRGETEKITLRLTFNPNKTHAEVVEKVRAAVENRRLTSNHRPRAAHVKLQGHG